MGMSNFNAGIKLAKIKHILENAAIYDASTVGEIHDVMEAPFEIPPGVVEEYPTEKVSPYVESVEVFIANKWQRVVLLNDASQLHPDYWWFTTKGLSMPAQPAPPAVSSHKTDIPVVASAIMSVHKKSDNVRHFNRYFELRDDKLVRHDWCSYEHEMYPAPKGTHWVQVSKV